MKKFIKYGLFMSFMLFLTFFINMGQAFALSCEYSHSVTIGDNLQTQTKYEYKLTLRQQKKGESALVIDSANNYVKKLKWNSTLNRYDEIETETIKMSYKPASLNIFEINQWEKENGLFLKLNDETNEFTICPTITIYKGSSGWYAYQDRTWCEDDHPYACTGSTTVDIAGVQKRDPDDVFTCTEEEKKAFSEEIEKSFQDSVDVYNVYYDSIKQHEYANSLSAEETKERVEKETTEAMNLFNLSFKADIDSRANNYSCSGIRELGAQIWEEKNGGEIAELSRELEELTDAVGMELEQRELANGNTENAEIFASMRTETSRIIEEIRQATFDNIEAMHEESGPTNFGSPVSNCAVLDDIKELVQMLFDVVKILAPLLLVIFCTVDFGKAVISNDNDAIKKATTNSIKRAIAAVAIFFLPLIINLILHLPEVEIGLNDALCGISKVVIR